MPTGSTALLSIEDTADELAGESDAAMQRKNHSHYHCNLQAKDNSVL